MKKSICFKIIFLLSVLSALNITYSQDDKTQLELKNVKEELAKLTKNLEKKVSPTQIAGLTDIVITVFDENNKEIDRLSKDSKMEIFTLNATRMSVIISGIKKIDGDEKLERAKFNLELISTENSEENIRINKDIPKEIKSNNNSFERNVKIPVTNLERGKVYTYAVKYDDYVIDKFVIVVEENLTVDASIGFAYSIIDVPKYEFSKNENDTVIIVNKNEKPQVNTVFGLLIRPWGYNPAKFLNANNLLFFVGIPLNEKIGDNIYSGFGLGTHGFSIIAGINLFRKQSLISDYGINIPIVNSLKNKSIDDILKKEWTSGFFISINLDPKIFNLLNPTK